MNSAVLESNPSEGYMTIGFGGGPNVELKVNAQETPTSLSIPSGILKKKNLKVGDVLSLRSKDSSGDWASHTMEEAPATAAPPAPTAALEPGEGTSAVAVVTFPAVSGASKYQVDLIPFDGETLDWVKVSDGLSGPGVKKKNLRGDIAYSFRYRALVDSAWQGFSQGSLPSKAPERSALIPRAVASTLMRPDGSTVDAASALSGKVVALYFSASWCPPCKQYTPQLAAFYKQMKDQGRPFEVVFVSSDQDEPSFREYFGSKMPWLAIPFNDPRREQLSVEHQIRGIPSVKVLSGNSGKLIDGDGRARPLAPGTLDSWMSGL